jgi:hypothetical protein
MPAMISCFISSRSDSWLRLEGYFLLLIGNLERGAAAPSPPHTRRP